MINVNIQRDLQTVKQLIRNEGYSIVVIKNSRVIAKRKGDGVKPLLLVIDEIGDEMNHSVAGDKILGKASALLLLYGKVDVVYSPQSTKKAINILQTSGVKVETDEVIEYIKNKNLSGVCPFEKMLKNVYLPIKAKEILTREILKK